MKRFVLMVGVAAALALAAPAAEPPVRTFTCPVDKLEVLKGELPRPLFGGFQVLAGTVDVSPDTARRGNSFQARLDGPGEVELVVESESGEEKWSHVFVVVRTPEQKAVTGTFTFRQGDQRHVVRWKLPEGANTTRAADWFNYGRAARLQAAARGSLNDADLPGQAWFRHQLREVDKLKTDALAPLWGGPRNDFKAEPLEPRVKWVPKVSGDAGPDRPRFVDDRGDPFQLLGGGRAISENLQLKRDLNVRPAAGAMVKISELKGIDVKEYDWTTSIAGLRPRLDPLAALVPADQHAVFFPDVPTAVAVMDELDRVGLAAINLAETRGTNARIADRYLTQLGMPSAQLGKLLPAALIDNVAITGSDLYFDTGTDMAVLLSTSKAAVVSKLVAGIWPVLKATKPDAKEREEEIAGIECRVLRTPDRRICCYLAVVGDAVLLANSPAQVRRISETKAGKSPPLIDSPEYIFFRDRYRRGDAANDGFAIMTDAAIRRWCSAKWRIGHERRIHSGAVLADLQASQLREMIAGKAVRKLDDPRIGAIEAGPHGVYSPTYGSRLFQTPIAETEIDQVTAGEADAYQRWRNSYQQNWSQFFDPIAIQISVRPETLAVDMTVIPLIMATEYRELVELTTGARLPPGAGDPHPEALAHFVMGFNRKSENFKKTITRYEGIVGQQFDITGWLGDWLTVYIDEDPLWDEFAKSKSTESEFWEKHEWRMPIAVGIAVTDAKKHAEFVTKFRNLIGAFLKLEWTDSTHKGVTYTRVKEKDRDNGPQVWSLTLPDQWILSTNEAVIRRAIERHLAPRKDAKAHAWRGDSVGFAMHPKAVALLRDWWGRSGVDQMQRAAWSNIPILNEWHGFGRVGDPVAFHEKWWGERLTEPAGGKYVWNAEDGTMESTLFGHPGRPKGSRAILPAAVAGLRGANFGLTFEKDGLRARIELARD